MPSTTFISAVILIFQNFSVPPYPRLSLTFYVSFSRCTATAFQKYCVCLCVLPKMHPYIPASFPTLTSS